MPSPLRPFALLVLVFTLSICTTQVHAFGPGIHVREADRFLELLLEEDPSWAEAAAEPMAMSYLHLGCISPDLAAALESLTFGHSKGLSYHLLDRAIEMGPLHRMFALGHLSHISSDASAHSFTPQALVGSRPIGMLDLALDDNGAAGEFEGIMESLGDVILGDYMAVVDIVYDFSLEGTAAWQRGQEILTWYCQEGNAYHHAHVDCDQMLVELDELVQMADEYVEGVDREGAKSLISFLIDRPPADLLRLLSSGEIGSLIEGYVEPSPHAQRELGRILGTAIVDPDFWAQYDTLYADLGPALALDHLVFRPPDGWPAYSWHAFVSGNIQSMMQFLPESYAPVPELIVDRVWYTDAQDDPIEAVASSQAPQTLTAHVRFFSALPFVGEVRGVMKRDHPGFDQQEDEVAGQGSIEVEIDPTLYTTEPRSELSFSFVAEPTGVLGFYLELYVGDGTLPWFTSSWDRLWTIGDLELDYQVFRDNFGTYGHWPPSLPVTEPDVQPAVLFVKVRIAPAGGGIDSAQIDLEESGLSAEAAANGIAVFSDLTAGLERVRVQADGYADPQEEIQVDLVGLEQHWVDFALHAIPQITLPGDWWHDGALVPLVFNRERFGDQVAVFVAQPFEQVEGEPLGPEVEFLPWMEPEISFEPPLSDGSSLVVRLFARYVDEATGLIGWSDPLSIDGSAPELEQVEVTPTEFLIDCVSDPDYLPRIPRHQVRVALREPHSPVVGLSWQIGDSDWTELEELTLSGPSSEPQVVEFEIEPAFPPSGDALVVAVTNAAGLEVESEPVALEVWDESWLCPPPEPQEDLDAGPDTGQSDGGPAPPATPEEGCGCGQVPSPASRQHLLLAGLLAILLALRRSPSAIWCRLTPRSRRR
ncbi:MAG: hypothetical protein JW797_05865 [Bradymonadales bacterium]|nr:hypothetical protein [Bradymonadales bacterium]